MKDETTENTIAIIRELKDIASHETRIALLEEKDHQRETQIQEIKTNQREKENKNTMEKDKRFSRTFTIIASILGAMGFVLSLLNFLLN